MTILGLGGIELANYSIVHMRVSQIAISLADNASRSKEQIVGGVPQLREYDINEAFRAAALQSGPLDINTKGRLILSSLETNGSGGQYIHWQRCFGGAMKYKSSYGKQGDGATGTAVKGMGPKGKQVKAEAGYAIMFAEVVFDYDPLIFDRFLSKEPIRKIAAMYVRDDRDLSKVYNPAPAATINSCPA
jgi:hypothetical protein